MYKVMIVEDDVTIARILAHNMRKWGLDTYIVKDFSSVTKEFLKEKPHIILLDITLPFFNGYYWCSEIRKISPVPIVFISSNSASMDIIMAMNMGGDDFITKPFDLEVAIAKVQALLRRVYSYREESKILEHKGTMLHLGESILLYNNQKIDLTKNEVRILQLLLERKGNVVARDTIMKRLWEDGSFVDDNTLTVNVTRLRKKLEDYGLSDFIQTKKGQGYIITTDLL